MPGGDRTGPYGDGPMTGRRMGYCVGVDNPGSGLYQGKYDWGFWRGRGLGRGMRRRFGQAYGHYSDEPAPNVSRETLLENEARILKEQLASLEKQLSELKKKTD